MRNKILAVLSILIVFSFFAISYLYNELKDSQYNLGYEQGYNLGFDVGVGSMEPPILSEGVEMITLEEAVKIFTSGQQAHQYWADKGVDVEFNQQWVYKYAQLEKLVKYLSRNLYPIIK